MRELFEQQTPEHYDGMVYYWLVKRVDSPYNTTGDWVGVGLYKTHVSKLDEALADYEFECMVDTAPRFVQKDLPSCTTSKTSSTSNF